MKKERLLLSFLWIVVCIGCDVGSKNLVVEAPYLTYCGSCHLAPDPANIPKSIWEDAVLPEMAARLGYPYKNHGPLSIYSMEERLFPNIQKTYPETPGIDSLTWQQILDYVSAHAPDSIPSDTLRRKRNAPLVQFSPIPISLDHNQLGGISSIRFESFSNQFMIGDFYGGLYQWPKAFEKSLRFHSPVIFHHQREEGLYVTEIGYMDPSEEAYGVIYSIRSGSIDTLAKELHRPVYTEIADLNDDGVKEILICEFGDLSGELSILVNSDSGYEKRTLLAVAGTIKVEIADMDNNGTEDIVVLASQGNEGVYILYQVDDLQFRQNQVIKMGPEYGSSWFELLDYDGDNHLDIVLVNGDNADYSIFLKPYHGLRLFLNDGKNGFEQKWFYPIYGATRVLAEDYDQDGDWDFAVMAYFPDFDHSPEESFIFLENQSPSEYHFEPFTFQAATSGRWLVMDGGDFDQDGDMDILLGSFLLPLDEKHKTIMNHWKNETVNLLLLENKTKN